MNCAICSDAVSPEESYCGMPLHRACLDAAEARRLAKYVRDGAGPTCLQCRRPIGTRDYPATYPWDSECACYPEFAESIIVDRCPVCGQSHELRICPVNEKSLLWRPCTTCLKTHPYSACAEQREAVAAGQPTNPRTPAPTRRRIAEPDAR